MTHPRGLFSRSGTEHSHGKCTGSWGRDSACQGFHYCGMDRADFWFVLCVNRIIRLWELLEKDLLVIDSHEANKMFRAGRCSFPKRSPNWWSIWNIFLYTAYFISNTRLNYKRQGLGGVRPLSFISGKYQVQVYELALVCSNLFTGGLSFSPFLLWSCRTNGPATNQFLFHLGSCVESLPESKVDQENTKGVCKRKRNWRHHLTFGFWPYLKPMAFFILLNEASSIPASITCDQK